MFNSFVNFATLHNALSVNGGTKAHHIALYSMLMHKHNRIYPKAATVSHRAE